LVYRSAGSDPPATGERLPSPPRERTGLDPSSANTSADPMTEARESKSAGLYFAL
jgi:hypothetical protein